MCVTHTRKIDKEKTISSHNFIKLYFEDRKNSFYLIIA
jgi:hypothetical protein